jgi:hypothetical protein
MRTKTKSVVLIGFVVAITYLLNPSYLFRSNLQDLESLSWGSGYDFARNTFADEPLSVPHKCSTLADTATLIYATPNFSGRNYVLENKCFGCGIQEGSRSPNDIKGLYQASYHFPEFISKEDALLRISSKCIEGAKRYYEILTDPSKR